MATSPEGAYHPTDEDIEELVTGKRTGGADDDPTDDVDDDADDLSDEHREDDADEDLTEAEREAKKAGAGGAASTTPAKPVAGAEGGEAGAGGAGAAGTGGAAPAAAATNEFEFKAEGGVFKLPGAKLNADGSLVIPKERVGDLRQRLANDVSFRESWPKQKRQLERQLREAQSQRTAKDVAADETIKWVETLLSVPEDQLYEEVKKLRADLPNLKLEVQRKQLDHDKAELERLRSGKPATPEDEEEALLEGLEKEVSSTLETLFKHPAAKHLTDDDKAELRRQSLRRAPTYLTRATEDAPDGSYKKGDVIYDEEDIVDRFKTLVKVRADSAQRFTAATAAAKDNAARNADKGGAGNPIPPTAGRTGGAHAATGSGKGGADADDDENKALTERKKRRNKRRKSKKARFLRGELDDPDA